MTLWIESGHNETRRTRVCIRRKVSMISEVIIIIMKNSCRSLVSGNPRIRRGGEGKGRRVIRIIIVRVKGFDVFLLVSLEAQNDLMRWLLVVVRIR